MNEKITKRQENVGSEEKCSKDSAIKSKFRKDRKGGRKFKSGKSKGLREEKVMRKERLNDNVAGNDLSWWTKDPELMNNAANVKPNYIPGMVMDATVANFIIPGVYKFTFIPTFGRSWMATDPLNVVFRDLYLRMFQKYRGITAYSSADLGLAVIAGAGIFMTVFRLERIYGIVNRYSKLNLNIPKVELDALGISATQADYIRNHLSDFRYDLNVLIKKAQRLCVPNDITCINDWMALLGFEYMDHDSTKATLILFDTPVAMEFEDSKLSTGGSIVYNQLDMTTSVPLIDTTGSYPSMFPGLVKQLDALLGSTSIQRIYADLLVWFGEGQLLTLQPLAEDFIVVPAYDKHICHRIHNIEANDKGTTTLSVFHKIDGNLPAADRTILTGRAPSAIGDKLTIYQLDDNIKFSLGYQTGAVTWVADADGNYVAGSTSSFSGYGDHGTILDSYSEEFTSEDVIEGHLFKFVTKEVSFGTSPVYYCHEYIALPFELIVNATMYTLQPLGTVSSTVMHFCSASDSTTKGYAGAYVYLDWAPICVTVQSNGYISSVFGDIETCRFMDKTTKTKILEAIIYSGIKTDVKVLA